MKYAQIQNGKVFYVYDAKPVFSPKIRIVECPDEVTQGWTYAGGVFTPPVPEVSQKPITDYADFIEMMGEDTYQTLSTSPNKKAVWIREVWSRRGRVNPNNPKELAALDLMLANALIDQATYDIVTGS